MRLQQLRPNPLRECQLPRSGLQGRELLLADFVFTGFVRRATSESTAGTGFQGEGRTMFLCRWKDNRGPEAG